MKRSPEGSTGTGGMLLVDQSKLRPLLGRMKVWELAQLAGMSVDALVASVVHVARLPAFPDLRDTAPKRKRRGRSPPGQIVATVEAEPDLSTLLGRATRREVRAIVDRWVLGRVLELNEWNITHAAAQLQISRRSLRERWGAVRDLPVESLAAKLGGPGPSPGMVAAPSLAELLERKASRREIHRVIDRWLVESTLDDRDGNVTHAASHLNTSRRVLRDIRDGS